MMAARSGGVGLDSPSSMRQETLEDRPGANLRGGWAVWWMGQAPPPPSGREWQGAQSGQGTSELGFPGPVLWQMQCEAARRAGDPSGQGEDPSSEGLGGHDLLPQADARCPAGEVVGHYLYREPGAVGGETARGHVVQPDADLRSRIAFSISA